MAENAEEIEGYDIDPDEFVPHRGDVYRGKSVKGGWSHMIYLATHTDARQQKWAVYALNDRGLKVDFPTFMKSLQYGDLEFVGNIRDPEITSSKNLDLEKLNFMGIGLASLGAGMSAHEHLEKLQQDAIDRGGSPLILDDSGKPM